ncbi:hypothetical protein FS418_13915 [Shewanella sp. YLB-09]|nr:hypothetical protein FS418_13915 [Shewanella sp. YLB-09]
MSLVFAAQDLQDSLGDRQYQERPIVRRGSDSLFGRAKQDQRRRVTALSPVIPALFSIVIPALLLAGIYCFELKDNGWIPEQESPGR